jgi:polysaccharide export outer membrane protein
MRVEFCALVVAASLFGCASTEQYTWVKDAPTSPVDGGVIQVGDTINVRVLPDERFSTHEKVRTDGKITLPIAGDFSVKGKRLNQVANEITDRLKPTYLNAPFVTVTFELGADMKVAVLGEVKTPAMVQLDHGANVLDALAAAGGMTEFADKDRIFVLRAGMPLRIRFRYADLQAGDPKSNDFILRAGDRVVVE